MSKLLDWAALGRQQFPPADYPVGGEGFDPMQAPRWEGNQLQIPGLGGLLQVGVNGGAPGSGGGGGGGGSGTPAGGVTLPGGGGGDGSGGQALNQGTLNANWYYDKYPAVFDAFNNLTAEDRAFLESSGYAPTYGGFAQYHYDTYGNHAPDWVLQGLSSRDGSPTGGLGGILTI